MPSKRLRNKIAGFITHLMRRIEKGPVRGISFKLQEEERERKDNYVPEFTAINTSQINVDVETKALLRHMDFANLAVNVNPPANQSGQGNQPGADRSQGDRSSDRRSRNL